MRSASTSVFSLVLIVLWAIALGLAWPAVAKSASADATESPGDASPAGQEPEEGQPSDQEPPDPPAGETPPASEGPATREPAAGEPVAGEPVAGEVEPDDGRTWIMDEEKGRRYSIEKVPKVDGTYIWRDEKHIRLPGGLLKVEVVKHDDEWFWVKLWEPPQRIQRRKKVYQKPTQEELDRAAATYRPEGGAADRIRLEPFDQGLPRSGQWRQGFDVADMNQDGHLDIVFGAARKGRQRPNIFLGDSHGHWRGWSDALYPRFAYDYGDAAVADFNGDGHQDVAFGIHLRGLLALVGDGKGGFAAWTEGLDLEDTGRGGDASTFSSRAIEAIDWNRDGRPDLLALGEGPKGLRFGSGEDSGQMINTARSFALFINQGDGTWSRQAVEDTPGDFGDDFAIGDFDRDGRSDLIIASRRRGNQRILRTSSAGQDGVLAAQRIDQLREGLHLTAVAAADLDGDGFEEILVGYMNRELDVWRTGIDLFTSDPEVGWRRQPVAAEESRAGIWDMAVGELDGDGAPDLVALTGEGGTWVLLGDGQGAFVGEESPELTLRAKGCQGSEVRLVDLDGDGRDEVLASFAGEPTGPAGLPGVMPYPGCPGQGRIHAWKIALTGAVESAGAEPEESAPSR